MEIFFFFFGIFLLFIVFLTSTNTRTTCDMNKKPHKWVWKGEDGNMYMVCETCKRLPGGGYEEGE